MKNLRLPNFKAAAIVVVALFAQLILSCSSDDSDNNTEAPIVPNIEVSGVGSDDTIPQDDPGASVLQREDGTLQATISADGAKLVIPVKGMVSADVKIDFADTSRVKPDSIVGELFAPPILNFFGNDESIGTVTTQVSLTQDVIDPTIYTGAINLNSQIDGALSFVFDKNISFSQINSIATITPSVTMSNTRSGGKGIIVEIFQLPEEERKLTLNPETIATGAADTSFQFTLDATHYWEFVEAKAISGINDGDLSSWLHGYSSTGNGITNNGIALDSTLKGSGGLYNIDIKCSPNTSYTERKAELVFKSGDIEKSITVTQAAAELEPPTSLILNPEAIEIGAADESFSFTLDANKDWEFVEAKYISGINDNEQSSWLLGLRCKEDGNDDSLITSNIFNNAIKSSSGNYSFTITCSPNTSSTERKVELVFRSGDIEKSITVTQAAAELEPPTSLILNPEAIEIGAADTSIKFTIEANYSWEFVEANAISGFGSQMEIYSWLGAYSFINNDITIGGGGENVLDSSVFESGQFSYSIDCKPNTSYIERKAELVFKSGNTEKSIRVTQAAAELPSLTLNPETITLKAEQTFFEFQVTSAEGWVIERVEAVEGIEQSALHEWIWYFEGYGFVHEDGSGNVVGADFQGEAGTQKVTCTFAGPNTSANSRTAKIYVKNDAGESKSITVIQNGQ